MQLLLKKWHFLEELKAILHLPYLSTVMLQRKDFTLSDFYGLFQVMNMKLNKIISEPNSKSKKLAADLQKCLNERKKPLLENPLMRCAIFLDPRYKYDIDSDKDSIIFVKITLDNIWQRIQSIKIDEQIEIASGNEVANKSSDTINDLFDELDEEYNAMMHKSSSPNQADFSMGKTDIAEAVNRYEQFVSGTRMKSSESVHGFWEKHKSTFGLELYEIASIIFAIPPTQSSVERYFSALKYLFNDHRYNLAEDLLESCLLVHLNPEIFEIVKQQNIMRIFVSTTKKSK